MTDLLTALATMLSREWQAERSEMARKLDLAAAEDRATGLASTGAGATSARRGGLWSSVMSMTSWFGKQRSGTQSANEGLIDA